MVRTIAEMAANSNILWGDSPEDFEDNLVYMICCGDFMRARSRRFPRSKITETPNSDDDFTGEAPRDIQQRGFMIPDQMTKNRTYYYDTIDTIPTHLMFSKEVEYADD